MVRAKRVRLMASPISAQLSIMGLGLAGLPQPMVERIASFAQRSDIPSLAATCTAANEACASSLLWKSHLVRMCPEMLAVCDAAAAEAVPSYRAVVKQLVMKPEHTTPSAFRLLLRAAGDRSCALQQCTSCGEDFFGVLEGAAAAALYEQAKLCWSGAASAQPVELIVVEANSAALCKLELAYGAGDPRVKLPEDADDTALYDEDVAPYYAIVKEHYDIDGSDGGITGSADTFNEITRVKLAMCFDVEACSDEESEDSAESSRPRPRPLSKVEEQLSATINEAESRAVAAEGICTEAQQMTSAARAALQRASGWLSGSIFESAADKSEREALAAKCEAARKAEHHADLDQDIARGQLQALLHSREAARRQRRREDRLAGLRATSVHLTVTVETELQQHSDGHRYQQQVDPSVMLRTLPYALPGGGAVSFVT